MSTQHIKKLVKEISDAKSNCYHTETRADYNKAREYVDLLEGELERAIDRQNDKADR